MPSPDRLEVVQHRSRDCWRTWYMDECENAKLFGVAEKHSTRLKKLEYRQGIEIFLEDAPFSRQVGSHHRVCGPYSLLVPTVPAGAINEITETGVCIIYREKHPERGPWFDSRVPLRCEAGPPGAATAVVV